MRSENAPESGALLAKSRVRGPTVSERRAAEQHARDEKNPAALAARGTGGARVASAKSPTALAVPRPTDEAAAAGPAPSGAEPRRGRAAANAPLGGAGGSAGLEQSTQALALKGQYRPASTVTALAPAGGCHLAEAPSRDAYPAGAEGEAAHAAAFTEWTDKTFASGSGQGRCVDQQELEMGRFADWHEQNKHGGLCTWVHERDGFRLALLHRDGVPVEVSDTSVMEWMTQVCAARVVLNT
jgi:hypothetical protein